MTGRRRTALASAERSRQSCRGAALLLMLLAVFVVLGTSFVVTATKNAQEIRRQQKTAQALAQAKEALLAWSMTRGNTTGNARPGELPCPDTSDPVSESASYGFAPSACSSGRIGRIPWKTLGIPEPLDANGEVLWYAVDGAFRTYSNQSLPLNSDTRASLQVFGNDGASLLTPAGEEAAAILFAAGPALQGQLRNSSTTRKAAANYLEGAFGKSNAATGGPFIQGPVRDANSPPVVNDQILVIRGRDLITAAEKRVAREMIAMLNAYKAANGAYPYPAPYAAPGCIDVGSGAYMTDCQSDTGTCRGRFPDNAQAGGLPNWAGITAPDWLKYNLWGQTIYYAVGSAALKAPSPALQTACAAMLTVGAQTGVSGLLLTAGSPLGTTVRSRHNSPALYQSTALTAYFEDTANQDGWTSSTPSADIYVLPGSSSNDRLYILP